MKTLILLLIPIFSFGQMDDGIKHIYAGTFISQGVAGLVDEHF